jgi:TolA-binding protein
MRLRPNAALLAGVILCVSLPPVARAQIESREGIALQNQILELRRDLQVLRDQGVRGGGGGGSTYLGRGPQPLTPPVAGGGGGSDIVAQLLDRVQTLEDQVRQLRGQVDENTNTLQRQNADLSKQIGDLSFQLQNGGAGRPSSPAPLAPPAAGQGFAPSGPPPSSLGTVPDTPPPSAPLTGPVRRTPELALQEGNAALARRDYPAAEAAAREVLSGARASPRAADAQFMLAQALEGERNYPQAAIAFDDAYNRSRTGARAPDALLGLANSLTAIGEKKAACETLAKLAAEFPRARQDVRDRAAATRTRAGCR